MLGALRYDGRVAYDGRAAKPKREGYTPAMQLVTPRAVAMAVRIEMAV